MPDDDKEKVKAQLTSLRRLRGVARTTFTKNERKLRPLLDKPELTQNEADQLSVIFEAVSEAFNKERTCTEEIDLLLDEGSEESRQELIGMSEKHERFIDIKCGVTSKLRLARDLKADSKAEVKTSELKTLEAVQALKYPTPEIEVYDGSPLFYQEFIDAFDESYHKNPTISDGQKLANLKSKTKGRARKFLKKYRTEDKN